MSGTYRSGRFQAVCAAETTVCILLRTSRPDIAIWKKMASGRIKEVKFSHIMSITGMATRATKTPGTKVPSELRFRPPSPYENSFPTEIATNVTRSSLERSSRASGRRAGTFIPYDPGTDYKIPFVKKEGYNRAGRPSERRVTGRIVNALV